MRRFLRVRILFVLIALLLVPAIALPFAERLRTEWARYWEPRGKPAEEPQFASSAALRALEAAEKQRRFLLAMEQIELSGVPFPDEPPLSYPTPERSEEIRKSLAKEHAAQAAR